MAAAAAARGQIELLEARRLFAALLERASSFPDLTAAAPIHAPLAAALAAETVADHIDAAAVRDELIRFVDTWNGGQAGRSGTSGMGTYAATWDGLFRMNLNRQFQKINYYTNDQTIVSQSRAIYMNVEAHRAAPTTDRARFKTAVQRGADYLLAKAVDPATYNGKPGAGGMWWGLQPDGVSPPTHTTPIFGTHPRHKDTYGQAHALFALAHAYSVTGDVDHLNGAFAQLAVLNSHFADTSAGAGAFLTAANENYTQRLGTRNLDYMTHVFEGVTTLHDVTPASDPRKAALPAQITNIGNFITTRMYRDAPGSITMGYLPSFHDEQWNPSADPAQQYSTPGHNIQMAFLLSRAVERGFNPGWMNVADKLVAHTMAYGFDNVPTSPTYGAVVDEKLAFDGTRFSTAGAELVWWQTCEAARTLLHFALKRGRSDLLDEYDAAMAFIRGRFIDPVYGGWFTHLDPTTLAPTNTNKGTVWTGGYHEAMLYAGQLRLAPPPRPITPTPFSGTPIAIPSTGTATIQAEHFDNGGEGIAFHDTDAVNSGNAYRTGAGAGVDIQPTTDAGGGHNVGWTRAGEWLIYTVNVATAGNYDLDFRVAATAAGAGGIFHLEVDGVNVTGALTMPNTGGWQTWQTVRKAGVALPAGKHLLRLAFDTAGSGGAGNFNYIKVTRSGTTTTTTLKSNTATFARDGSFASTNYGANPSLEVKKSTTGYTREAFVKFDLTLIKTINTAKLRLFGNLSDTALSAMTLGIHGSAAAWTESALTWNTRPATGAALPSKLVVSGTTAKWYEVDVTAYLKAEKAAGRHVITLALKSQTSSATVCVFTSDEGASGPELRIT